MAFVDTAFKVGVLSGIFTGAGLVGSTVLADHFSAAAFLTCGLLSAAGASLALDHAKAKFPPPDAEEQRWKEQNPWVRAQDRVITEAEQNAAFGAFMKKSGVLAGWLSLGAAAGLLTGHLVMTGVHYFKPAPPPETAPTQTIKKIEELGYWNRPDAPAP